MAEINRRQLLGGIGAAVVAGALPAAKADESNKKPIKNPGRMSLDLNDFEPKSMLHVSATDVQRPKFPVIDIHTHITWQKGDDHGVSVGEEMTYNAPPEDLLEVMDRRNLHTMVNRPEAGAMDSRMSLRNIKPPIRAASSFSPLHTGRSRISLDIHSFKQT